MYSISKLVVKLEIKLSSLFHSIGISFFGFICVYIPIHLTSTLNYFILFINMPILSKVL